MNKKIITRFLALATCAAMLAESQAASFTSPVAVVEAADSATTQAIKAEFDPVFYANTYADVKQAFGTNADALYKHFIDNGMREGRMLNAGFDPKAYIEAYADIKTYCNGDYTKAYEHYVTSGKKEGRNLTTFKAINDKKAKEQAAAAAAEAEAQKAREKEEAALKEKQKQLEKDKITERRRHFNIGHGLEVHLSEDQYRSCEISILSNDYGYAAYIDGDCYDRTSGFHYNDSYPYSYITVSNGNIHETVFERSYKETYYEEILDFDEDDIDEDDDYEDALMLLLLMAELDD